MRRKVKQEFSCKKGEKSGEKEKEGEETERERGGEMEMDTEGWRKADEVGQGGSGFSRFFAVESERARGKSAAQFLHGLLRFKVDLRAATASFGFDHPRPKKVNDQ